MPKKIKTLYKTPKKAAEELAHKIRTWIKAEGMGDKLADEVKAIEWDGTPAIAMEIAFEAANGFTDGTGIFGYEGYGKLGATFDEKNSGVHCEPINGCVVGIYAK